MPPSPPPPSHTTPLHQKLSLWHFNLIYTIHYSFRPFDVPALSVVLQSFQHLLFVILSITCRSFTVPSTTCRSFTVPSTTCRHCALVCLPTLAIHALYSCRLSLLFMQSIIYHEPTSVADSFNTFLSSLKKKYKETHTRL